MRVSDKYRPSKLVITKKRLVSMKTREPSMSIGAVILDESMTTRRAITLFLLLFLKCMYCLKYINWLQTLQKCSRISKGQLISKCPFQQLPGGLSGSFLGFLGTYVVSNIINKEAYRKPISFQEAPTKLKKNSGQKSRNNFVGILDETRPR